MTKPRCMAYLTKQNSAPWCLFDSTTREDGSTNVVLEYSLLEATGKKLGEEKALFDCFDRSYILGFGNIWHQGYGKT